jgi:lysophospholipase L1-like esterase
VTRTRRPSPRRALGAIAGLAVAIGGVTALTVWHPWSASPVAGPAAAGATAAVAVEPLELPDSPRVLVFGDSWTYGSAATTPELGYAYVLADLIGGETVVDGVRGSGYLVPGIDGGTFGERIVHLDPTLDPDLVIIEGSINDRRVPAAGYVEAVDAAWDALAATYPDATVVVLGPAPQVLPVETPTARIDRDLSDRAAGRGWAYISPLAEQWITTSNYPWVIDTGIGRNHPTTAGHAYLAERVAAALDALRGSPASGTPPASGVAPASAPTR